MGALKFVAAFLTLVVASEAFCTLTIKNGRSTATVVNVDGIELSLLSGGAVGLVKDDTWSGEITATPADAEVTDGPKTTMKLSLGNTIGTYVVSLANGYNVGAKIIPRGGTGCSASLCTANLNARCPVANQVTNSLGTVVACENEPTLMGTVCPLAQVSEADTTKIRTCVGATSYLILIN